jgi:hypothetical protein
MLARGQVASMWWKSTHLTRVAVVIPVVIRDVVVDVTEMALPFVRRNREHFRLLQRLQRPDREPQAAAGLPPPEVIVPQQAGPPPLLRRRPLVLQPAQGPEKSTVGLRNPQRQSTVFSGL